jgi:hypothetical protein
LWVMYQVDSISSHPKKNCLKDLFWNSLLSEILKFDIFGRSVLILFFFSHKLLCPGVFVLLTCA